MLPDWLPWLLQVNDSQFPSGAYAHSMGLEELTQRNLVSNPAELETFLHDQIIPGLLAFELPFLARAHRAAVQEDLPRLRALDDELEAWKLAAELRQASRQIGSRRLDLVRKLEASPLAEQYAALGAPCHHLIICALELRHLPAAAAGCAFGLQTLSGSAIAAMKLIRMGQERCQLILRRAIATLAPQIEHAMTLPPPDRDAENETRMGWFNPLVEIASMRHARAHERLFIS
jgi:urease accessory protein